MRCRGVSWTAARDAAANRTFIAGSITLQGHLATITSQAEQDFLESNFSGIEDVWLGASDATVEGEWRWVTDPEGLLDGGQGQLFWQGDSNGTAIGYENWIAGVEPNNLENGTEDYAGWNHRGLGWNDYIEADTRLAYFVEYSEAAAVPEPSSLALLATGALGFIGYGWRRKRKLAA